MATGEGRVDCQAVTASEQQAAGGQNVQLSWRPSIGVGTREVMHFLFLYYLCLFFTSRAQSISTSTPVPPLQWINLTSLLQGPSAPPLKDASIGYDNTTRTIIIFGGESQGGLPQQQTYLSVFPFLLLMTLISIILPSLNLDSLVWSSPTPQGGTSVLPPPRSAAVGGGDFAAS